MPMPELELIGAGDGGDVLAFDSVCHPDSTEWTRVHVDAVLGDVVSPLAWTVVGAAFERSHASVWRGFGVDPGAFDGRARYIARRGGRIHLGLDPLREAARRMPTVDPTRIERELGLPGPGASTTWRDRLWYPSAAIGTVRTMGLLPMRLRSQRRLAVEIVVRTVDELREQFVRVLVPHHVVRMLTDAAIQRLRDACGDDDLAFGLLADLPDLEATEPSLALHRIAVATRASGAVDAAALDAFRARFGHRGVNELDPTARVWSQQGDELAALVERLASDVATADPRTRSAEVLAEARATLARQPSIRRDRARVAAVVARRCCVAGERSKSIVARHVHRLRVALDEVRAASPIPFEDTVLLGWDELRTSAVDVDLDARRAELARAQGPLVIDDRRHGRVLDGIGASPGRAGGSAVVVHDPLDPVAFGGVLVAHATDTAWTPLFLGRRAVVTDVGGVLSHSSIVARDLGIPAVVGTGVATSVIRTGDHADVDGDRGIVTVAAR